MIRRNTPVHSSRSRELRLATAPILLVAALAIACGGQEGSEGGELAPGTGEAMVEDPAAAKPSSDAPKGARETDVAEVRELFSEDLPEWKAATIAQAIGAPDGTGLLELGAETTVDEATDFYRETLGEQGWALTEETTVEEFTVLEFERGGELLTVTIEPDENGVLEVNLVNR